MRSLLMMYVRMLVEAAPNASVEDEEGEDDVDESSSAGAVAGYTLPLGASADDFRAPQARRAKKR